MKNKAIFTEVHAPHTGYFIDGFDSAVNSGECSVGFVSGQYSKMNAVVSEHATEQDHWHVVNLIGQINGKSAFD